MKLIPFPEVNTTYAKNQPQYLPLPAHRFTEDPEGRIAFCWRASLRERLRILITGKLWHEVLTFQRPLQPQRLSTEKPEMRVSHPLDVSDFARRRWRTKNGCPVTLIEVDPSRPRPIVGIIHDPDGDGFADWLPDGSYCASLRYGTANFDLYEDTQPTKGT